MTEKKKTYAHVKLSKIPMPESDVDECLYISVWSTVDKNGIMYSGQKLDMHVGYRMFTNLLEIWRNYSLEYFIGLTWFKSYGMWKLKNSLFSPFQQKI